MVSRGVRSRNRAPAGTRFRPLSLTDAGEAGRQREAMFLDLEPIAPGVLRSYRRRFLRWFGQEFRAHRLFGVLAQNPEGRTVASGLLWLQPRHPTPMFPQLHTPYILSVYTEPEDRRRGLGTAIVRSLVETARELGFPRVELHATEVGRGIYYRLGFRPTNQMRLSLDRRRKAARGKRMRMTGRSGTVRAGRTAAR